MGTMMDPRDFSPQPAAAAAHEATAPCEGIRPQRVRRALRATLAPIIAGLLLGGITYEINVPRYAAQARVWIDGRTASGGSDGVRVLTSRDFARQVIETHRLGGRLAAPAGTASGALSGAALRIAGYAMLPDPAPVSRETLALRTVERGLNVREAGSGQVSIDFVSPDPRLSADVANAFAANFVELRQTRGPFNMDPNGPTVVPARVIATAVPAMAPRWPTPLLSSLVAGIGTFLVVFGFQSWTRRRQATTGEEFGAVPMPETTPQSLQHLPWIGGSTDEPAGDGPMTGSLRLLSREREQADLSRLVELRGPAARLVTVTGSRPDEAIARCAVALGRSLAGAAERRVVVVCLDVASQTLDGLTADPRAPGLTDLLTGVAGFSDAIHREGASRCHVIPPGRGAREADGLVAAERLPLILTALKQTYDHVILAAPPLGGLDGAARIASLSPTTILVTQPGGLATDAVQAFDALAALGFGDIAMITFTPEGDEKALSRAA